MINNFGLDRERSAAGCGELLLNPVTLKAMLRLEMRLLNHSQLCLPVLLPVNLSVSLQGLHNYRQQRQA